MNFELIIAVAAFMLSLSIAIHGIYSRYRRLEFFIMDYKYSSKGIIHFFILLVNKSATNLSVTSFQIENSNDWIQCELEPKRIRGFSDGDYNTLARTPNFPIHLTPYGAANCYLEFLNCQDIALGPGTIVSFQIHTSRGPISKTVTLGNTAHYLHMK